MIGALPVAATCIADPFGDRASRLSAHSANAVRIGRRSRLLRPCPNATAAPRRP